MNTDRPDTAKATLLIIVVIVAALFRVHVITVLWRWFMVPLGVMELSWLHAFGLCVLIGLVWSKPPTDAEMLPKRMDARIGFACAVPILALLFGWIAKEMML